MIELKVLPEQKSLEGISSKYPYRLSKEFRRFIDGVPFYTGVLLEDKKTVDVGFMSSGGYKPELSLDYFVKGILYAQAIGKTSRIYVPKGSRRGIEKKINEVFKEARHFVGNIEYPKTSKEIKAQLAKSDATK